MIRVKLCGINTPASAEAAVSAGADFIGLVHYPKSPRHVSLEDATALHALIAGRAKTVLVTVNADDGLLARTPTDFVQLHGSESLERVEHIRMRFPALKLIKAIAVRDAEDVAMSDAYTQLVDYIMFDAKSDATLPGGNGIAFDWTLLKGKVLEKPWMLSGGLTPENVLQAIRESGAAFVDVSSGIERAAGVKDEQLMRSFVKIAKN